MKSRNARRWRDEDVVITGGSQGIGLALATELAGRCRTLTLIARDAERLRQVTKKLHCEYVSADVSDLRALELPALANCSMLICCAAEVTPGRVTELTPDVFRRQMEVNFVGTANAVRNALPNMVNNGRGTIVLMGSTASLIGIYRLLRVWTHEGRNQQLRCLTASGTRRREDQSGRRVSPGHRNARPGS